MSAGCLVQGCSAKTAWSELRAAVERPDDAAPARDQLLEEVSPLVSLPAMSLCRAHLARHQGSLEAARALTALSDFVRRNGAEGGGR